MKEKSIVSTFTLLVSLASYFYARHHHKDAVPYVMVGGFIGAVIGEALVHTLRGRNDKDSSNPKD